MNGTILRKGESRTKKLLLSIRDVLYCTKGGDLGSVSKVFGMRLLKYEERTKHNRIDQRNSQWLATGPLFLFCWLFFYLCHLEKLLWAGVWKRTVPPSGDTVLSLWTFTLGLLSQNNILYDMKGFRNVHGKRILLGKLCMEFKHLITKLTNVLGFLIWWTHKCMADKLMNVW